MCRSRETTVTLSFTKILYWEHFIATANMTYTIINKQSFNVVPVSTKLNRKGGKRGRLKLSNDKEMFSERRGVFIFERQTLKEVRIYPTVSYTIID